MHAKIYRNFDEPDWLFVIIPTIAFGRSDSVVDGTDNFAVTIYWLLWQLEICFSRKSTAI